MTCSEISRNLGTRLSMHITTKDIKFETSLQGLIIIINKLYLIMCDYFRANYLDANCVKKYGIYMPRKDPGECFILRPKSQQSARSNKMRPGTCILNPTLQNIN